LDNLSDNTKSKILTTSTPLSNERWSFIYGKEYNVIPNQNYKIITSMKLNNFVKGSHIVIQGYNFETSLWNPIGDCPSGISGPMSWTDFSCVLTIPDSVSKIRIVINGGYSTKEGAEAISWFREVSIEKDNGLTDVFPEFNQTDNTLIGRGFGHITDMQVGPDGNLYVLAIGSEKIESLDKIDGSNNKVVGTLYKIAKK
jgi:hypothetical protein